MKNGVAISELYKLLEESSKNYKSGKTKEEIWENIKEYNENNDKGLSKNDPLYYIKTEFIMKV